MRSTFYIVTLFILATCAPTVWQKPDATTADFTQDSARCRLLARSMNSGDFYAEGSPKFVAAATVGNALGTAIGQHATYEDCMMAVGYTPHRAALSGPLSYGAAALDQASGTYGFSSSKATPQEAENMALRGCNNAACTIVFRVGPQQCGAIALAEGGRVWGGATRPISNAAEAAAMENCQKRTKGQCMVKAAECNR